MGLIAHAFAVALIGQTTSAGTYLTYSEAKPVIDAMGDQIPVELKNLTAANAERLWGKWIAGQDQSIRARLSQGDEDSLVNLLLFGTSFTKQPRILFTQIQKTDGSLSRLLETRIEDFVAALDKPGSNERMIFAREVMIAKHGFKTATVAERDKIKQFLQQSLVRILQESDKYKQIIDGARMQNDPTFEFAERSKLYKDRGLSSDTQTQPNFALEQALKELKSDGKIPGSVLKVGIVGPGLDFTDKQEGYDFYPLQSIQPFVVMDSLIKLGLSDKRTLRLTTMDISPRINLHIRNARKNALAGKSYVVTLPREKGVEWTPEFINFWKTVGNQIGREKASPQANGLAETRVVEFSPAVVANVSAADVNIVLQDLNVKPAERFDLIIATNILIYYDAFQQALALVNIEKMLKPGGIFLCNNSLLELDSSNVHSIGYTTVKYSTLPPSGDVIVWYQKSR